MALAALAASGLLFAKTIWPTALPDPGTDLVNEKLVPSDGVVPPRRELTGDAAVKYTIFANEYGNLRRAGKWEEALGPARAVLEICRRELGDEDWRTLGMGRDIQTLEQIAALPRDARDEFLEAQKLMDQGGKYWAERNYVEALKVQQREEEIWKRHLGEERVHVANILVAQGCMFRELGQPAKAEEVTRKAQRILIKLVGEEHLDTLTANNNLAASLNMQGKYDEAAALHRQTLSIRQRVFGEDGFYTAVSRLALARILDTQAKKGAGPQARKQAAEAEEHYQKVAQSLIHARRQMKEPLSWIADLCSKVAGHWDEQGEFAKAEALHRLALQLCQEQLGEFDLESAGSCIRLAVNLEAQGKHAEAASLQRSGLTIVACLWGQPALDSCQGPGPSCLARLTLELSRPAMEPR